MATLDKLVVVLFAYLDSNHGGHKLITCLIIEMTRTASGVFRTNFRLQTGFVGSVGSVGGVGSVGNVGSF